MSSRNKHTEFDCLDSFNLDKIFQHLNFRLSENKSLPVELVVCGGASLIATGLVSRTTQDVDVLALSAKGVLLSPDPLPTDLILAVQEVAEDFGLSEQWLNNRPSMNPGGLFQMGLPNGLAGRCSKKRYDDKLTLHYISRVDQISLILFAAADRGGYHITDLLHLNPNSQEILIAARWTQTHNVSECFSHIIKDLLEKLGFKDVVNKL